MNQTDSCAHALFMFDLGFSEVAHHLVSDIVPKLNCLASLSRPALGPTQPPVQWVPEVLSPGVKRGRGVTLTTHPHLVPRS
jgi:hypothetical protein